MRSFLEAFRRYTNGYTSSIHHSYRYRSLYSGTDRKRSKRYCFKHIQQVMDIKAVNVVETANIPDEPSSPSVPKNGVIGGLLGILLAAAVVLIVYLTNDTVKTPEDVEKYLGLSVLGTIPYSSKMGKKSKRKRNVTHKNNNNGSKCWERPGAAKI